MTIGVRTSAQFEAIYSRSVGDRSLDKNEFKQLETEFKKLNPDASFHDYMRERMQSQVDPKALALMSLGSSRPVELVFPQPSERLRLTGSGELNFQLTDRNGLATEARNDLTGSLNGKMQLSGVTDIAGMKFDFKSLQDLGFQSDAQGRLTLDPNSIGGWANWGASFFTDTRSHVEQGLRSMGIEATLKDENGRMVLEPRSMKMTGEQLIKLGINAGVPPKGEVEIDLRQARLQLDNGQLSLDFKGTTVSGSSDTTSAVDASQAPAEQAENLDLSLSGTGNFTSTATPDGQSTSTLQLKDAQAKMSMDMRSLQSLQQRLNSEDVQSGSLHGQMRSLGLTEETISQIKTGSQEVLERLMRDPGSRVEMAVKASSLSLSGQSFESVMPEMLTHLQSHLKKEEPSGALHRQLQEAGVDASYLQEIRNATPEQLKNLFNPPAGTPLQRVTGLSQVQQRLQEALDAGIIPNNAQNQLSAVDVDANLTTKLADGKVSGELNLHADLLSARLSEQRQDVSAHNLTGTANGALTLTTKDVEDVKAQLDTYKTWLGDQLKTLGLSQEQFNQVLQLSSRDNLKSLLSSATPQKVSELATKLGISEDQTRQLSEFLNTPSLQKSVDDLFRLTEALGDNTRLQGGASFNLGYLGWTQTDQSSLLELRNLSAAARVSSTTADGQHVEAQVTASAESVTGEIGPDGKPRVETSAVDTRVSTSGQVHTHPSRPAPSTEQLRKDLANNEITRFYNSTVGLARDLEQRTGVPASVLMASVVTDYRQANRSQKASFDALTAFNRQAQELAQRYPKATEAFKQEGTPQSFMAQAEGLSLQALTPRVQQIAHERQATNAEARFDTQLITQNDRLTVQPGSYQAGQTTSVNGETVSETKLNGNFGELKMSEQPEILDAIGATLQREYDQGPRKMQPFLESLGFNTDQIRSLRTATPEQRRNMLRDPALRPRLEPLIQSLNLGSFSFNGNNNALGENTQASLTTGAINASGGQVSLKDVKAEIQNGKLVLNASASRIDSNKAATTIGNLSVTAGGESGRVSLNSPELSLANGGQLNGTVSGDATYRPNDKTKISGDFTFKLANGQVTGTRIGNGQIETELTGAELLGMTQHDPDAKAFIQGLQSQGIAINPNQRIKVRLSEVGLTTVGQKGQYQGTIELPQIKTSMGDTRLRLNVRGSFANTSGTQDIHGNVVIKPDLNRLGQSLNQLTQSALDMDPKELGVNVSPDAIRFDFSSLFVGGAATVRADGQNVHIKVDRAKFLGLFDVRDTASRKIIEALGNQGIRVNQETKELTIPVTALSAMMGETLPSGMQIENLRLQNGELSGTFRYQR